MEKHFLFRVLQVGVLIGLLKISSSWQKSKTIKQNIFSNVVLFVSTIISAYLAGLYVNDSPELKQGLSFYMYVGGASFIGVHIVRGFQRIMEDFEKSPLAIIKEIFDIYRGVKESREDHSEDSHSDTKEGAKNE